MGTICYDVRRIEGNMQGRKEERKKEMKSLYSVHCFGTTTDIIYS
jgi:hypothetical protein